MEYDVVINVGKDFVEFPGDEFKKDSHHSGESFRQSRLVGPLRAGSSLLVDLDDTVGCTTAWLRGAFSRLVSDDRFNADHLPTILTIKSDISPHYLLIIDSQIALMLGEVTTEKLGKSLIKMRFSKHR